MADSRQLNILKLLTAHLQEITPENGFEFDLSDVVFRGRTIYGDNDPVPMISIVEHLQPDNAIDTAGDNHIMRTETWILLIQGWTEPHPVNMTDDAYQLKAAVEKKLSELILIDPDTGDPMFPDKFMLGLSSDGITNISIGPGIVSGPRQQLSSKAFFYLPVGISMAINVSDPFVSP